VEPEEIAITLQWLAKHMSAETDLHTTVEELLELE
jgi:hypothetical protein